MKNNYSRLKRSIVARTLLISVLSVAVGYGILTFLVDGVFQDSFANLVVRVFMKFGMNEWRAIECYNEIFIYNKTQFVVGGFCILFLFSFYVSVGRLTRYLNSISEALEKTLDVSDEPILLPPELEPMADTLSTLKQKLKRREKQAAESEKRKNELVVYLAHDLKTPLTSVIAYLTMLDEQPDMSAEDRAKYTHITLEKAIRLEELINEFFDITRFNLQNIVLDKELLNLSILLEQLADESYGMLSEKNMTCAVDVEEKLMFRGDPDKLARVFDNLLRNAAAYGYEDTQILIQARGGNGRITIIFTNEGPQIPQKKLEMIFEKFYRVDDARSSRTGGAGLGLAIARQIVELHGGSISAASDSRNTRFIVSLPSQEV
ncbi:MAG: sensor histidine kinase [Lachnospiraceae bacterium]|uniref:sensor histidine kinase n=1 Tax=Parablautia sp. Marseille-Q6255 TaxID=3039593 RepID=UPI0024BC5460|nr:HAMP domain-containing sensor histidine kinase [Parablautia sp. Marseille-Q6255]